MRSLQDILKELSLMEVKSFEKFLKSPYYNKSKKLKILFREIRKFYPEFTDTKYTPEYLSKKISPSLKYNPSTFRGLIADLQTQLEDFLIIQQLSKNDFDRKIYLLKALVSMKNDGLFNFHLRKAFVDLEKEGIDSNYYYNKSYLELLKFNNNKINRKEKSEKNIKQNLNILISYIINLTNFFITEVINSHLKFIIEESKFKAANQKTILLKIIESIDINKISLLVKEVDKNNFTMDLYLNLFLSFRNIENQQYYLNYKKLIAKHSGSVSKDELSYHYSMLISYCMLMTSYNKNKIFFDKELFSIYNTFLKEKLFINNKTKYINEELFRNILMLSLRLKKFEWAADFISTYSKYLHPKKVKNILNLSMAEYHYHLGSFTLSFEELNKTFDYLKEIKEELFIIKYDIKILYLMLYYDLGYVGNLITHLNNYRKFLFRNNLITDERKAIFNKFLNILEKMIYLKEGDPKINITNLNLEILKLKNFNYKEWLSDKLQAYTASITTTKLKQG